MSINGICFVSCIISDIPTISARYLLFSLVKFQSLYLPIFRRYLQPKTWPWCLGKQPKWTSSAWRGCPSWSTSIKRPSSTSPSASITQKRSRPTAGGMDCWPRPRDAGRSWGVGVSVSCQWRTGRWPTTILYSTYRSPSYKQSATLNWLTVTFILGSLLFRIKTSKEVTVI